MSAHDLADYYSGYAQLLLGPHLHLRTAVVAVRRVGERWDVTAEDGRVWRASALVVATGQEGTPHVPALAGLEQFGGTVLHSSRYRNGAPYRGARALVVGMGNSGAEICLDLHEHGAPRHVESTRPLAQKHPPSLLPTPLVRQEAPGRLAPRTSVRDIESDPVLSLLTTQALT